MKPPSAPLQAFRFARGLRSFLRDPIDLDEAVTDFRKRWEHRGERFLEVLDDLVWPVASSPHRRLLEHAGAEPGDIRALVMQDGVEGALTSLRDQGVYVAYEEYLGHAPVRRGSATFHFEPRDFANARVRADYMATSGGTRTTGTASGSSFAGRREQALVHGFLAKLWRVGRVPYSVWFPALPGAAGLGAVLNAAAIGNAPECWYSQTDPAASGVPRRKRFANDALPVLSRAFGTPLPAPEHTPTSRADVVLDWCVDALARADRVMLAAYTSSAVALAHQAMQQSVSLRGLVLRTGGEPLTPGRRAAIEASGANVVQLYAFAPAGMVAAACTRCPADEMHLLGQDHGLITRERTRPDGVGVDAFLWTSFQARAGQVMLNTENDDYGDAFDSDACDGPFRDLGMRRRLRGIRGTSKVVAGGITMAAETLERVVDEVLPQRFGGAPSDYQFAESNADGAASVILRVSPSIGPLDETVVIEAAREALAAEELGTLALGVWTPGGAFRLERTEPRRTRSGKTLPFEPLRR